MTISPIDLVTRRALGGGASGNSYEMFEDIVLK